MSQNFSILFIWSKGATHRRYVLQEISRLQELQEPIYVSKLSDNLSKSIFKSKNGGISISAIRKHVKILIEYDYVEPLNKGGKPEYLQLTENGKKALEKLQLNN